MHVEIAVLATLAFVVAAAVAGFVAVRRYIRRRWQRYVGSLGLAGLAIRLLKPLTGALLDHPWWSPTWRGVQLDRARMWRSVNAARHAVVQAGHAGAPIGELTERSAALQRAAGDLDRMLRIHARTTLDLHDRSARRTRRHVSDVMEAARAIRGAALSAMEHTTLPAASRAVQEATQEAQAVHSGVSTLRSAMEVAP